MHPSTVTVIGDVSMVTFGNTFVVSCAPRTHPVPSSKHKVSSTEKLVSELQQMASAFTEFSWRVVPVCTFPFPIGLTVTFLTILPIVYLDCVTMLSVPASASRVHPIALTMTVVSFTITTEFDVLPTPHEPSSLLQVGATTFSSLLPSLSLSSSSFKSETKKQTVVAKFELALTCAPVRTTRTPSSFVSFI